MLYFS
jgi:hypothetical protein